MVRMLLTEVDNPDRFRVPGVVLDESLRAAPMRVLDSPASRADWAFGFDDTEEAAAAAAAAAPPRHEIHLFSPPPAGAGGGPSGASPATSPPAPRPLGWEVSLGLARALAAPADPADRIAL